MKNNRREVPLVPFDRVCQRTCGERSGVGELAAAQPLQAACDDKQQRVWEESVGVDGWLAGPCAVTRVSGLCMEWAVMTVLIAS
jgi:hypothetical protein